MAFKYSTYVMNEKSKTNDTQVLRNYEMEYSVKKQTIQWASFNACQDVGGKKIKIKELNFSLWTVKWL